MLNKKVMGVTLLTASISMGAMSHAVLAEGLGGLSNMASSLAGGDMKGMALDAGLSKLGLSEDVVGKVKPIIENAISKAKELGIGEGEVTDTMKSACAEQSSETSSALGEVLDADKANAVMDLIKSQLPEGMM